MLKRELKAISIVQIVIIALLLIIALQKCDGDGKSGKTSSSRDTVISIRYHYVKDSGHTKPIFIKGERDTILETSIEYMPSEDYDELLSQFEELKQTFLSRNVFQDSIPIDTFGYVSLYDTIQKNNILGRAYKSVVKVPEKTITITNTIYPEPKRQMYIGGGIFGNKDNIAGQVQAGLLLKNKKDQIFGVSTGINANGQVQYGISSYWKIKIK